MNKNVRILIAIAVLLVFAAVVGGLVIRNVRPVTKYPVPAQIADNKAVTAWGFQASGKVTDISGTKITIAAAGGSNLVFNVDTATLFVPGAFFAGQAAGSLAPYKNGDIKVGDNIVVGLSVNDGSGTPKAGIISFSK